MLEKKKKHWSFPLMALGVIRPYVWQIAFLLLQQDLLTISIRAHGWESSVGEDEDSLCSTKQWSMMCRTMATLYGCLSDVLLTIWPLISPSPGSETYREVSIEVVFPVKQRLFVDGAVESQACHDRCFHTPFVEDLKTHAFT